LSKVQDYFGDADPEVATYLDYQRKLYQRSAPKPAILSIVINRLRGSLSDFIGLSDGLLCGGIVLVSLSSAGYPFENHCLDNSDSRFVYDPNVWIY
jgi:hypothetical protein